MSCLSFDLQYIKIAREILSEGTEVVGRGGLRYKQVFGQTIKIDLRDGFPALTLPPVTVATTGSILTRFPSFVLMVMMPRLTTRPEK